MRKRGIWRDLVIPRLRIRVMIVIVAFRSAVTTKHFLRRRIMEEESQSPRPWSLPIRIAVLTLLMLYLSIVVLAPMTNPAGAPELTTPVAKAVSPVHQALYLNHGYRFFAPDPGPSHSLIYEIETADGQKTKGHFPDRENTSPRLLYHRWFMLSESMYREYSLLSLKPEIDKILETYDQEIAAFAQQGELEKSKAMTAEKDEALAILDATKVRFDELMLKLARNLVARFGEQEGSPKSIRMWIRRRTQPSAAQSLAGVKLIDESLEAGLVTQAEVAYFTAEQLAIPDEVKVPDETTNEPELESISPAGADNE